MINSADNKYVIPNAVEIALAKNSIAELGAFNLSESKRRFLSTEAERVEIPESIFQAVIELVHSVADGKGFMLVPLETELGTQEAADLLNVSRPYFVKLLDEEKIPYRYVGRYRRVRHEDVLQYQNQTKVQTNRVSVPLSEFVETNNYVENNSQRLSIEFKEQLINARRESQEGDL